PMRNSGSIRDGFKIRRTAISQGIPVFTNLKLAASYINSIFSGETEIREISEYSMTEGKK
ncbi:MAG: hypothetical protein ACP5UV_07180, partial [Thermoplasmata archaeon]